VDEGGRRVGELSKIEMIQKKIYEELEIQNLLVKFPWTFYWKKYTSRTRIYEKINVF